LLIIVPGDIKRFLEGIWFSFLDDGDITFRGDRTKSDFAGEKIFLLAERKWSDVRCFRGDNGWSDPRGDSRCFFGEGGYSGEIITFCETKNGDGNTFPSGDLNGSDCFLGENGKSEEKEEKRL
jgi:hypothetical protein